MSSVKSVVPTWMGDGFGNPDSLMLRLGGWDSLAREEKWSVFCTVPASTLRLVK